MCNEKISYDINFTSFPISDNKILSVDFGIDAIGNVSIDQNNKIKTITRSTVPARYKNSKFILTYPSLPLPTPNKRTVFNPNQLVHQKLSSHFSQASTSEYNEQYNLFAKHHTHLLYKSLQKIDKDNCLEIKDFLTQQSAGRYLNSFLPKKPGFLSFRGAGDIRLTRLAHLFNKYRKIAAIGDLLSDIPYTILTEYIDESLFHECEEYNTNANLRNCIQYYYYNNKTFIICPQGELLNVLTIYELAGLNETIDVLTVVARTFSYAIKGVEIINNNIFIKGDFNIAMLEIVEENNELNLLIIYEKQFDEYIHDTALNQSYINSYYVVAANGNLASVTDSHVSLKPLLPSNGEKKWYACTCGSFQQTVLVSNEKSAVCYDFRVPDVRPTIHTELPCQNYNRYETLSPVLEWSTRNAHQYYLATSQSLVVCDERYLKTPILKVNHYIDEMPRFISCTELQDDTSLIVLGDYTENESVCIQFMPNGVCTVPMGNNISIECNEPMTTRQPIFKMSSYKDWCRYVTDWRLSEHYITDRISTPTMGMAVVPIKNIESSENEKSQYYFLQQNLYGDLFHQFFSYSSCHSNERDNTNNNVIKPYVHTKNLFNKDVANDINELNHEFKLKCFDWLSEIETQSSIKRSTTQKRKIFDIEKDENENKKILLEKNNDHVFLFNGNSIFEKCDEITSDSNDLVQSNCETERRNSENECSNSDTERHNSENECRNSDTERHNSENECRYSDTERHKKEDEIIKFDSEMKHKILNVKNDNKILTRKSLGLDTVGTNLRLVQDIESYTTKPLSKLLYTNWNNAEEYLSLETVAPYTKYDPSLNSGIV